jgi:hypothetical protein
MQRQVQIRLSTRAAGLLLFGIALPEALSNALHIVGTDLWGGSVLVLGGDHRASGPTPLLDILRSQTLHQMCLQLAPFWIPLILGAWLTLRGSTRCERWIGKELKHA